MKQTILTAAWRRFRARLLRGDWTGMPDSKRGEGLSDAGYIIQKGLYQLNEQPNFNFRLNRVVMWDSGRVKDIEPIAARIIDSSSWKREMIGRGDAALEENRVENAVVYYRVIEFFMYDGDEDKLKYYRKAATLF